MMGTTTQPRSRSAAVRLRSRRNASGPLCQSTPSYSAATRLSGQAKSSRQVRPLRSTTSYCSTGGGNPPSSMTNRASLSIGDSASGEAKLSNSRTVTMPRRPDCRSITALQFAATARAAAQRGVQCGERSRPTQPARYLDRRPSGRGRRPSRDPSRHQGHRCAITTVHEQTSGRVQSSADGVEHVQIRLLFGVEAVHRGRSGAGRLRSSCRSLGRARVVVVSIVNAPWPYTPYQSFAAVHHFLRLIPGRGGSSMFSAWAEVTTPPCWSEQPTELCIHAAYGRSPTNGAQFTVTSGRKMPAKGGFGVHTSTLAVKKKRTAR